MKFKKFQNKILVHLKTIDVAIDHIFVHFIDSKAGLYVSFRIRLYVTKLGCALLKEEQFSIKYFLDLDFFA